MHSDIEVKNGSTLSIQFIKEGGLALICKTTKANCCKTNHIGHWYYPNASKVGISTDGISFYRNRTNDGKILLHKHPSVMLATAGTYCCVVPDSEDNCGINQKLCVNLGKASLV